MLILGLLLLAATGSFVGLLISDNLSGGPDYTPTVLGNTVTTMNSLAIFCAGLALALLFCLGLAMMAGSAARHRRRRALRVNDTPVDEPAADTGHRRRTRHILGH
ncbi:hypothetical protein [Actinacidiphila oryziradicis]|jgi:hypothetical protein|uniref:hypothetical protein n=1 Tax=Actinacidiphila oryziradicis TaxID=2571141 RepID=UPI0023F1301F|nr:hypothetical protein [Actinacidiphila oryziradicis]MCW2875667.1 hypothetical protein [Actinacidiphila oryziradicis]